MRIFFMSCFQEDKRRLGSLVQSGRACDPSMEGGVGGWEEVCYEFKVSLEYIVSSKPD